jgi:hypothetical protein
MIETYWITWPSVTEAACRFCILGHDPGARFEGDDPDGWELRPRGHWAGAWLPPDDDPGAEQEADYEGGYEGTYYRRAPAWCECQVRGECDIEELIPMRMA